NRWTAQAVEEEAQRIQRRVMRREWDQVLAVPTDPLQALITSPHAGDLISEDAVYYANLGMWHVGVFNQLVTQQSELFARHLSDLVGTGFRRGRRRAIARAVASQSRKLHRDGVGEADEPGGWYRRLREEVETNIARLERDLERRFYPRGEAKRLA